MTDELIRKITKKQNEVLRSKKFKVIYAIIVVLFVVFAAVGYSIIYLIE